jgi:cyclopropane fatty-acyl-phospholipid synthase-like methyltransferase
MLDGRKSVLEIGAGDGWASRIVARSVVNLTVTDFDPEFTKECQDLGKSEPNVKFRTWNPLTSPWSMKEFDSCYLLDVLEHIDSSDEDLFMKRIISALTPEAVIVVGMPSIESQPFASKASKLGHVNCKTSEELKTFLEKYFVNVFSFGMNDEVLHTGFARFRQYLFCIGSVPRK